MIVDDGVAAAFKSALRGVAATVSIITAHDGVRHHGMTATSVTSLSMDPPALLICLNRSTLLHDIMASARVFCVNVLDEGHEEISAAFSGALPAAERFAAGNWRFREDGLGYLADAECNLFCAKAAAIPYGTHTIFIGQVTDVLLTERRTPLIYKNAGYCTSQPRAQLQ